MELKRLYTSLRLLRFGLLIVPYGIETHFTYERWIFFRPFNRTLWN